MGKKIVLVELQKQKKKKTDETYKANSKAGSTSNYKHELRKLDTQINITYTM